MTAFASATGSQDGISWAWEMRSVNGRGLDVRTRLPEGCEVLEPLIKAEVAKLCKRGTINVNLRVKREAFAQTPTLNPEVLTATLESLKQADIAVRDQGLSPAEIDLPSVLAMPGVFSDRNRAEDAERPYLTAAKTDISDLLQTFETARAAEGAALKRVLADQLAQIQTLLTAASSLLEPRRSKVRETLKENVQHLLQSDSALDPDRLAQELALLAVKSDVAEEVDRLAAHIDAAQDLLETEGPIGRKFDFLTQEFNREANTLCSKANFTALTQIGLDLKTVIDQMREQVQNVE